MNAASSITNNDNASDRPAVPVLDTALTCDPFLNLKLNLLSSNVLPLSQLGKLSCITLTLVTKFFATSCVVAITKQLKSCLNNMFHKIYPADNVEMPNCLDLSIILYL